MPRKNPSRHVPERFLRQLWKHQYFSTSNLKTTDNKPVEVLSSGIANTDGGPDFVNTHIRIGGILYRGDVELHHNYDEWKEHSHHLDPKYNGVILHVVLNSTPAAFPPITESKRHLPVLVLDTYLAAPYQSTWEKMILAERSERLSTIPCCSVNDVVDASIIRAWLNKLAVERMELKVRRFEEQLKELVDEQRLNVKEPLRQYGEIPFGINLEDLPPPVSEYSQRDFAKLNVWNQLLYEGIMEALGYSKNQQAFRKLARLLPLRFFADVIAGSRLEVHMASIEAVLFGVSGLLPPRCHKDDKASKKRVRELRSIWKEYRMRYHGAILNEAEWQFFRLRPENFPTVRLAGATRLIPQLWEGQLFRFMIQMVKIAEQESRESVLRLKSHLVVPSDEFWSAHYRFGEEAGIPVKKLIGEQRAEDILLNVVLPISLLYARIFKEKSVRHGTLKMFEQCPPLSDNAVTRMVDKQLLKGKFSLDTAMLQQGALQLYKLYCAEERCNECVVGKVVFGQ